MRILRSGHKFVRKWNDTQSIRPSTTAAFKHLDKLIIDTQEDAMEIATRLTTQEQNMLKKAIEDVQSMKPLLHVSITKEQSRALFLVNALPFVGFGCLDNMIMILAGEFIDQKLGTVLCISTMAAAAIGNLVSDVAGVGLAHYVEILVNKAGIKHPPLTPAQLESSNARFTTHSGRAIGLTIGCIIGMFPLLFVDKEEDKKEN